MVFQCHHKCNKRSPASLRLCTSYGQSFKSPVRNLYTNGAKQVALYCIFRAVDYVNRLISQVFTFSYRGDIRLADWSDLGNVLTQNTRMNKPRI